MKLGKLSPRRMARERDAEAERSLKLWSRLFGRRKRRKDER